MKNNWMELIEKGKVLELRTWLEKDLVKVVDKMDGWTMLGYAIESGKIEVVELLLDFGADIEKSFDRTQLVAFNHYAHMNWSPLGYAIEKKEIGIVRLLLGRKADVEKTFCSTTPLCYAIEKGNEEIMNMLIDAKADKNRCFEGWTALGYCIEKENEQLLQKLLQTDIALEGEFDKGTPLEYAIKKRNTRIVFELANKLGKDKTKEAFQKSQELKSFKVLNFTDFGLDELPAWICWMPEDITLKLEGNPLRFVPASVKEGGSKSLMRYAQDIEEGGGKVKWTKTKVIVLGKEGVGKTHLYQRLRGNTKYNQNISTNGIDINTFGLNGMELTWFDFGGQEVFYPTHQFFLTSQCIYLVVFRLDDPDYKERTSYWLQNIHHFSQDLRAPAQTILVGTHADLVSEERREQVWMTLEPAMREAGNVIGLVNVSCKTGEGFNGLLGGLQKAVEVGNLGVVDVPNYYTQVASWMVQHKDTLPKLSFNDLVAALPSLSPMRLEFACLFLANMGYCFFSASLGIVVTDLQWLSDMFKGLITFENRWVKDGIVLEKELPQVWPKMTTKEILENMMLLRKFHIAFPKVEEGRWVIPSMLCAERRSEPQREDVNYERIFQLEMIPLGLMGRLIVRMQSLPCIKITEMWKSGMTFFGAEDDDGGGGGGGGDEVERERGEVVVQGNEIRIRCCIMGKQQRSVIQKISEECVALLKSLFQRLETLPYQHLIVCGHCLKLGDKNPTKMKYEDCVKLVLSSEEHFLCKNEKVGVETLGPDVTFSFVKVFEGEQVEIKHQFASGGFGNIYEARMLHQNNLVVVVKELKPEKIQEGFSEFQHEVSVMSKLEHPNLVQLFGILLNPLRMVLEMCSAGDLMNALRKGRFGPSQLEGKGKALPPHPLCWKVLLDIARGMEFLHSQTPAIAHRDLRSPNVLMVAFNVKAEVCAKVADFGLSVGVTEKLQQCLPTWQWMAPEAQSGEGYTQQCDLYSFAIVTFEIFRGQVEDGPFGEFFETMREADIHRKIYHENLRPTIPRNVPLWMQSLMEELWQHEARKRPSFTTSIAVMQSKGEHRGEGDKQQETEEVWRFKSIMEDCPVVFCLQEHRNTGEVWTGNRAGMIRGVLANNFREFRVLEVHKDKVTHVCCLNDTIFSSSYGMVKTFKHSTTTNNNSNKNNKTKKRGLDFGLLKKSSLSWLAKGSKKEGNLKEEEEQKENNQRTNEVIQMISLQNVVVCALYSGTLRVLSEINEVITEVQLEQHITCMGKGDQYLIVATGQELWNIEYETKKEKLSVQKIPLTPHKDFIKSVTFMGYGDWTSCTLKGEIAIWNARASEVKKRWDVGQSVSCQNVIMVSGKTSIWIGIGRELLVYSRRGELKRRVQVPKNEMVCCVENVGLDCAWVSTKDQRLKGSLYALEFF